MNEPLTPHRSGYIDGRERRAAEPEAYPDPADRAAYLAGHAEGIATPTLLDADGKRSIFDDVDL